MKKCISFFDSHSVYKRIIKILIDVLITFGSYIFVVWWRNFLVNSYEAITDHALVTPGHALLFGAIITVVTVASWGIAGKYRFLWRGLGNVETSKVLIATCTSGLLLWLTSNLARGFVNSYIPYSDTIFLTLFASYVISTAAENILRFIRRSTVESVIPQKRTRVMIVGAGWTGSYAVSAYNSGERTGRPVVIVDDDEEKVGKRLLDVPIKGKIKDIPELAIKYNVREIVIAIPSLAKDKARYKDVLGLCSKTDCKVRVMSQMKDAESDSNKMAFRELNIADFLSRDEIRLDMDTISSYLSHKRIMVTGGGGSIGSELCRQIMKFNPEVIIVFDIYENTAYDLQQELIRQYGKYVQVKVLIGSIRDKKRLDEVFETEKPSIVFHAAAHKHVPLMEDSPAEAIKNNVVGTYNLIRSASEHGVERFVQISTDKAVNPTNVMGATKRMCEMIMQCFAKKTEMKCMAVRFGNVLGSHGSVIPLFESQIKSGGPVTVTHPDIIRYFMTIPEAAQLVLQAGSSDRKGAIYVLDMGEPVKIKDLAENLIRFHGYEPGVDIEIKYTGLRPGEKLYEELLMDEEEDKMVKTGHEKIFVASPLEFDESVLASQIEELSKSAEHNDLDCVKALAKVVTTFHPDYERL